MKERDIRDPMVHQRYLDMVRDDALRYFNSPEHVETVVCPACGVDDPQREFRKADFIYVSCANCKTLYVNPRPRPARLEEFYIDSPSSQFWVEEFFKPVLEARREKIFRPRAEDIASRLTKIDSPVLGDVGAGFGVFLDELRKQKPESRLVAIEPSPKMAEICRDLDLEVKESMIENLEGHDEQFDFLCSFELFEHLHTPQVFVGKCRELLKPGGRLLITTLNGQGFDIQMLWEASRAVFPPHHLNFFNPQSINCLLSKSGFEIESLETPGALDWDIVEGALERGEIAGERFWNLLCAAGSDDCKTEFQEWLVRHRLSSHLRVMARKV